MDFYNVKSHFYYLLRRNQKPEPAETEFTFIWFKKLHTKNTTHFTAPFRTKVTAKTREEAKQKLADFIMNKMKLIIVEEKDFPSEDIARLQKYANDTSALYTELLNKLRV